MGSSAQLLCHRAQYATTARHDRSQFDSAKVVSRAPVGLGDAFRASLLVKCSNSRGAPNTCTVSPVSLCLRHGCLLRAARDPSFCSSNSSGPGNGLPRIEARHSVKKEKTKSRPHNGGKSKKFGDDRKRQSLDSSLASREGLHGRHDSFATPKANFQEDGGDEEEDPFEKLFIQLERDLEAGGLSDDDEVTEDDLLEFENQLNAALMEQDGDMEFDDVDDIDIDDNGEKSPVQSNSARSQSLAPEILDQSDDDGDLTWEDMEDEDEEQRVVTLEPWQLKKMAAAAQLGRRRANIKALAADVGLDRADVLAWLKDPPPEMLMYCASMQSEEDLEQSPPVELNSNSTPESLSQINSTLIKESPDGSRDWHGQKRLKKVHIATFERVFRKTNRPSNYMVQNLVELTHVPRKRIVDWFEERRQEVKPGPKFDFIR